MSRSLSSHKVIHIAKYHGFLYHGIGVVCHYYLKYVFVLSGQSLEISHPNTKQAFDAD